MLEIRQTLLRLRQSTRARWLLAGLVLGSALWIGRAPLLRAAAWPLIADAPLADATGASAVWILPGADQGYAVAARWQQEDPRRQVLLVEPAPGRLVEGGFLPSYEAASRRELGRLGVSPEAIRVIGRDARSEWESARRMTSWLEENRGTQVLVLADRFHSAQTRSLLDGALGADAARVKVVALSDRRFDEGDWWKSRTGVKEFLYAWLARAYTAAGGQPQAPPPRLSPEDLDRWVERAMAEAGP